MGIFFLDLTMNKLINSEYLTIDAADYFQRLIRDIDQAQQSIELETYIFEADKTGNSIINALSAAAGRDVSVRVIIDGFGSSAWITNALHQLKQHNVEVKIYHPMPWRFWQWGLATNQENFFNKLTFLINVLNRRNHRKLCIIDNKIHWLGSFNLSNVHLAESLGGKNWRDSAIRVITDHREVLHAFNKAWLNRPFSQVKKSNDKTDLFRLNNSLLKRRRLYRNLLRHFFKSENKIFITTPYFIPEEKLLRKLKLAARRGVDVRILLPQVSDVFFIPWASSLFYSELLIAGVKIYEYKSGILHAKTLIVDDWAIIGSSNMNSRSIRHDLEIDYELQNQETIEQLKNQFLNDIKHSTQIDSNTIQNRNPILKLVGHLVLYLRYWL